MASILDPIPSKAVKPNNISISCALAQTRQNMLFVQILRPSKKTYTDIFLHSADMLHVVWPSDLLKHSMAQSACCCSTKSAGAHHILGSYKATAYLLVAGPVLPWWPGRQFWPLVSSATTGLPAQQQSWFSRYLCCIRSLLVHIVLWHCQSSSSKYGNVSSL